MSWFRKRKKTSPVTIEDIRAMERELQYWKREMTALKRLVAAHETKIRKLSTRNTP